MAQVRWSPAGLHRTRLKLRRLDQTLSFNSGNLSVIGRHQGVLLLALTISSLFFAAYTAPTSELGGVWHSLSVGFVVSAIFYALVVYIPERRRRRLILRGLERRYADFKESCITQFLTITNSQDYKHRAALLDQGEFRRYFKSKTESGEVRWDTLANGLADNRYSLKEILYELRLLNEEIRFVRSTIELYDEKVSDLLTDISHIITKMEATEPEYDDVKSFCGFLWSLFTGWSWAEGYTGADPIKNIIGRAK